ncbi:hypothetical protein ABVT39_009039 [Epinephelus coioides]
MDGCRTTLINARPALHVKHNRSVFRSDYHSHAVTLKRLRTNQPSTCDSVS